MLTLLLLYVPIQIYCIPRNKKKKKRTKLRKKLRMQSFVLFSCIDELLLQVAILYGNNSVPIQVVVHHYYYCCYRKNSSNDLYFF